MTRYTLKSLLIATALLFPAQALAEPDARFLEWPMAFAPKPGCR